VTSRDTRRLTEAAADEPASVVTAAAQVVLESASLLKYVCTIPS
jgi:hypothetical protein